eukprot:4034862-Ditylum_brightwellii.AAC.1
MLKTRVKAMCAENGEKRKIELSPDENSTGKAENSSLVAPDDRQRNSKSEIQTRQAYFLLMQSINGFCPKKKSHEGSSNYS